MTTGKHFAKVAALILPIRWKQRLLALIERKLVMKTSQLQQNSLRLGIQAHQWGGLAFMLGNVLFVFNKLNEMSRLFLSRSMPDVISGQDPLLILVGQVALIFGYIAYYQFYARRVERLGKIALQRETLRIGFRHFRRLARP